MKRDLRFEIVYPNRIEEVLEALTDPGALANWLMENDFQPVPGHQFHLLSQSKFGTKRRIPCRVLLVEEPRVLSWSWGEEGSVVTFRLEPVSEGTRLTLEHAGLKGIRGSAMAWLLGHGWRHKIEDRLPALLVSHASRRDANPGTTEMGKEH